ncbi:MAG: alpha/beta hydrolase [Candidatus Saccharimonadales bacterium]
MTQSAILVHGWNTRRNHDRLDTPTMSNSHWFPWLTNRLMVQGIHTVAVEMPRSYYPVYEDWKREFERFDITPETILIGHSCGGGFLVRWLSEHDVKVDKVVLVAPWIGVRPEQDFDASFFEFEIDENLTRKTAGLTIFNSTDDNIVIQESVQALCATIKDVKLVEFESKGHFTRKSLGIEEFPELLEEVTA